MKLILFAVSVVLVFIGGGIQLKMLRLNGNAEKISAFLLLAAANIVLSTYILSAFSFLSVPGYLAIQTLWVLAFGGLRLKSLKYPQPAESVDIHVRSDRLPTGETDAFPNWLLVGFFSVILATALINLFLSIYVPPNNDDSMTYHLSRVGYWLQQGSLHHYYTHKWSQNALPPNAEILILWSVAFLKSDILANVFQWMAYCGIGLAVYLVAGLLGHGRRASAFAALIYLSLPIVVLESSSTQNDLVVTFFAVASFYFFHSGLKQKNRGKLLLSGIALGLAVGTKLTVFYILPALAVASLILFKKSGAKVSFYARWCAFCLVGILVFGSYNYFQNYQTYGNPISPPQKIHRLGGRKNIEKAYLNALRLGYDAGDFRGLPRPLESYLSRLKEYLGKRYFNGKNIRRKYATFPDAAPFSYKSRRHYHEDSAWFGVIGFFLYFPAAVWFFLRIFYKFAIDESWVYAFMGIFFLVFICFMLDYSPWKGRYFVLPTAFVAPLVASFTRIKHKTLTVVVSTAISLTAALVSVNITLNNYRKPLLPVKLKTGSVGVLNADFYQKRAGVIQRRMAPFIRFIEEETGPGARIGHVCRVEDWDYIFFGRDFSRVVIPIKKSALRRRGTAGVLRKNKLDFLILSIDERQAPVSPDPVLPSSRKQRFFRIIRAPNRSQTNGNPPRR